MARPLDLRLTPPPSMRQLVARTGWKHERHLRTEGTDCMGFTVPRLDALAHSVVTLALPLVTTRRARSLSRFSSNHFASWSGCGIDDRCSGKNRRGLLLDQLEDEVHDHDEIDHQAFVVSQSRILGIASRARLHERDRVQPHGCDATGALGQDRDDRAVACFACHSRARDRPRGQHLRRLGAEQNVLLLRAFDVPLRPVPGANRSCRFPLTLTQLSLDVINEVIEFAGR